MSSLLLNCLALVLIRFLMGIIEVIFVDEHCVIYIIYIYRALHKCVNLAL